ncbi:hypothetical protein D806_016100 [Mycolicibacterium smegmatis MKD8]|uniref:Uncharacterized protein n=2 Tax=Mycolicibacterium smegmatis TaxID=1772 RepID=A0A2U9PLH0_MYCSE|nr:hypothetical protein D806_016100 [Mycolicibacterium smegmatis MKD8]
MMTWYEGDDAGPSELVLKPTPGAITPPGGISQTVLREVDISAAIDFMRRQHQEIPTAPPVDWAEIGPTLAGLSESGLTDEYLAALAWAYSEAAKEPKAQERLAELTGKSPAAIKSHLWHATRRDLLERMPGRKGGVVTPKALKLISQLNDVRRELDT